MWQSGKNGQSAKHTHTYSLSLSLCKHGETVTHDRRLLCSHDIRSNRTPTACNPMHLKPGLARQFSPGPRMSTGCSPASGPQANSRWEVPEMARGSLPEGHMKSLGCCGHQNAQNHHVGTAGRGFRVGCFGGRPQLPMSQIWLVSCLATIQSCRGLAQ